MARTDADPCATRTAITRHWEGARDTARYFISARAADSLNLGSALKSLSFCERATVDDFVGAA
jgi:hypothetical protein